MESERATGQVQPKLAVSKEHFIFVRKIIYDTEDAWKILPQKIGRISRKAISRQEWDRACERQLELSPGDIVVARQNDSRIEVFEEDDYNIISPKMNSMFDVNMYNFADPPSIYPERSRSQRSIGQKLADDLYEAIREHYGKVDIDHAYICGDPANPILRIMHVGKKESQPMIPVTVTGRETTTSDKYIYPVLGFIDENTIVFGAFATDEELSRYGADGTLKWCWWTGSDPEDKKPKRKSRNRHPKNKKCSIQEAEETASGPETAQARNRNESSKKTEDGDTATESDHMVEILSNVEDKSKPQKPNSKVERDNKADLDQKLAQAKASNRYGMTEITESSRVAKASSQTRDSNKAYVDVAVEQIRADLQRLRGVGNPMDKAKQLKFGF